VLAEFFKERGVAHRLETYTGVLHSFLHCSAVEPLAMQALEDGAAFLRGLPRPDRQGVHRCMAQVAWHHEPVAVGQVGTICTC
jgi:hypothetical protein